MIEGAKRIGIMGGTFDPIHLGHLRVAEIMREEAQLDRVFFIPAAQPPHKAGEYVTSALHRLRMTHLATLSNPYFSVLDIEARRKGPSYSYDTLRALSARYGAGTEFYFIIGADELAILLSWHKIRDMLSLCHFLAAKRKGVDDSLKIIGEALGEEAKQRVHLLDTAELEISATDIRERIHKGKSIRYLVPPEVIAYIGKEGLYS